MDNRKYPDMKYNIGDIVRVVDESDRRNIFNARIINYDMHGYDTVPLDNNHTLTHGNWRDNAQHWTNDRYIIKVDTEPTLLPDELFTL